MLSYFLLLPSISRLWRFTGKVPNFLNYFIFIIRSLKGCSHEISLWCYQTRYVCMHHVQITYYVLTDFDKVDFIRIFEIPEMYSVLEWIIFERKQFKNARMFYTSWLAFLNTNEKITKVIFVDERTILKNRIQFECNYEISHFLKDTLSTAAYRGFEYLTIVLI